MNRDIKIKKIALLHDMAGFGRCSLSVIMPVLSVMGHQAVAMPTALLSTHTGGFEGYTFLDLTAQLRGAAEHYSALGLSFEGIYTGFLGSAEQIGVVYDFIARFKTDDTLVVVDPVMADDGVMYSTYTPAMCEGMKRLCAAADVITPNVTEAYLLLDEDYRHPPHADDECMRLVNALSRQYACDVVITGICPDESTLTTLAMTRTDVIVRCDNPRVPASYPGTGDIFAAVLTGSLLRGDCMSGAVGLATDFVCRSAELTYRAGTPQREGVLYEALLHRLAKLQTQKDKDNPA